MIEDLSRLKSNLANGKMRETDFPTYQVINALIDQVTRLQKALDLRITEETSGIRDLNYLTHSDESGSLTNSKELLAGAHIAFDDSVINERTISGSEWDVLTDGDLIEPEVIFAGGEVIMVENS